VEEKKYWLALSRVRGVGPKKMVSLVRHFGSPRRVWHAGIEDLVTVDGIGVETAQGIVEARKGIDPDRELDDLARTGARVMTIEDEAYPENLAQIYDPPPLLYYKGEIAGADRRAVSIVGSRRCTSYGRWVAYYLAGQLASRGYTVVSGLARGIDTAAHRGALAAGGRTIAVLGSGINVIYPPENDELASRIAESGALVTEVPVGSEPDARHFPARNRIISGLSLGTVVVEAGERSGALITADLALEQNREVFAVPGSISAASSRGPHKLIKQGAKLVENAGDIVEELEQGLQEGDAQLTTGKKGGLPNLGSDQMRILEGLRAGPINVEALAVRCGLPPARTCACLTELELMGRVVRLPGNFYVLP